MPTMKMVLLIGKNYVLRQRTSKNWLFGVFKSSLKRLPILLYNSYDAQTHNIAGHVDAQEVATIKEATLQREKLRFVPKDL